MISTSLQKKIIAFSALFFSSMVSCQTIFTYQNKESENDTRIEYARQLLDLALKNTEKKYGAYKLVPNELGTNAKRSIFDAKMNRYPNFFVIQSVTTQALNTMGYVPFPVDRGIVGYRVAFVSEQTKEKLKSVDSLAKLKDFTVLQGTGWQDIEILQQNGFDVIESAYYQPMFKMVARNRAGLFIRGANELLGEWQANKHIENLTYDESIVIHYPLPRFFFTSIENTEAIKRVHEGILKAYQDGSLLKLWRIYYQPSVEFSSLTKRKVFEIENPLIKGLDFSYEQYNYDPFNE